MIKRVILGILMVSVVSWGVCFAEQWEPAGTFRGSSLSVDADSISLRQTTKNDFYKAKMKMEKGDIYEVISLLINKDTKDYIYIHSDTWEKGVKTSSYNYNSDDWCSQNSFGLESAIDKVVELGNKKESH